MGLALLWRWSRLPPVQVGAEERTAEAVEAEVGDRLAGEAGKARLPKVRRRRRALRALRAHRVLARQTPEYGAKSWREGM